MSDPTPTPSPVKPGWKTSEFWLTTAAAVLSALFASGIITAGSQVERVAVMIAMALGTAGYAVSRGNAKALMIGFVLVFTLALPGCVTVRASDAALIDANAANARAYNDKVQADTTLSDTRKSWWASEVKAWNALSDWAHGRDPAAAGSASTTGK